MHLRPRLDFSYTCMWLIFQDKEYVNILKFEAQGVFNKNRNQSTHAWYIFVWSTLFYFISFVELALYHSSIELLCLESRPHKNRSFLDCFPNRLILFLHANPIKKFRARNNQAYETLNWYGKI